MKKNEQMIVINEKWSAVLDPNLAEKSLALLAEKWNSPVRITNPVRLTGCPTLVHTTRTTYVDPED
jgi:hypothetical protein